MSKGEFNLIVMSYDHSQVFFDEYFDTLSKAQQAMSKFKGKRVVCCLCTDAKGQIASRTFDRASLHK